VGRKSPTSIEKGKGHSDLGAVKKEKGEKCEVIKGEEPIV